MRELEKILEEIDELRGQAGSECTSEDHYIKKAWEHCLDRVVGIIRKHLNDGWIPVDDRDHMPDAGEHVIVSIGTGFNPDTAFLSEDGRWMMLPEPYHVGEIKLKPCPKCGKLVKAHGGPEEWMPTYYDPDSGGEPYYIKCECGMNFCAGTGELCGVCGSME